MEPMKLDWSTAEVQDGKLAVALETKPPKEWTGQFKTIARLLDHGRWTVTLKKGVITVEPITEGDEESLRHFLESAMLEADAALAPDDAEDEDDPEAVNEADAQDTEGAEADDPDAEMTERFRAFGSTEPHAQADAGAEPRSRGEARATESRPR